jgi:phage portal protein BeeE
MGLTDRLRSLFTPQENRDYWPWVNYDGNTYPLGLTQTLLGNKEEIGSDFLGLDAGAFKSNPVVFACMQARRSLFAQATFMWRQRRSGNPGELFSTEALELLRHPWPGATTGDLLSRAMQDADLAGNSFWVRRPGRLARLRPDWVTIVHAGSDMWDPDTELIGYQYQPGGPAGGKPIIHYLAQEVAHFAPTPDPIAPHRGMSWLTPLIREVQADSQMTTHKSSFLASGATPNLVVTGVPSANEESYRKWVAEFEKGHKGARNAGKSLYLSPAMDAKVIGSDMAQIDFKAVQGLGETRIAAAAGVPAAVVGISEGLAGSSLNAGNFAASMRRFADLTMRDAWANVCGSFEVIVPPPPRAELFYDDSDIPALKDDIKSYAEVQGLQAQAIRSLVDAGYEPDSVVDSINAGDLKRLRHSGLYSVQLQPPMPEGPPEPPSVDELPDLNADTEDVPNE